jgi:transglutaminase-like putative cysteine protease
MAHSRFAPTVRFAAALVFVVAHPIARAQAEGSYLEATRYIDSTHPSIVETARSVVGDAKTERERAVRIHDFVRDRIRFGWAPAFYDQRASEVLRGGVGFCNTKSTLFVALLRAAGVSARQHFVDINTRIVADFIDPGTPYVDHSFSEVLVDGEWRRVDSYIVDRPLAERARARLTCEGKSLGYGVHRNGVSEWDGTADAFSQLVNDGTMPDLTTRDHGLFDDVGAFYASGRAINRLPFPVRLIFGFFTRSANAKIEALRGGRD